MGWIDDELLPWVYGNYPAWEGAGKHVGIIALHPISKKKPAKISFTGDVDMATPVLCVEVCGNAGHQSDFVLQCVVDDVIVDKCTVNGTRWRLCEFDLSKYLDTTKTHSVQLWNAAGGVQAWSFEHCYIDKIYFKTRTGL